MFGVVYSGWINDIMRPLNQHLVNQQSMLFYGPFSNSRLPVVAWGLMSALRVVGFNNALLHTKWEEGSSYVALVRWSGPSHFWYIKPHGLYDPR